MKLLMPKPGAKAYEFLLLTAPSHYNISYAELLICSFSYKALVSLLWFPFPKDRYPCIFTIVWTNVFHAKLKPKYSNMNMKISEPEARAKMQLMQNLN